jgi:hypothetical protein
VVAIVLIVVSLQGGDESASTSTVAPTIGAIDAPADVATTVGAAGDTSAPGTTIAGTSTAPTDGVQANRLLAAPGTYTCLAPGSWQPFVEVGISFAVGEAVGATTCSADIITLPAGHCSATPCAEIPDDWEVRQLPGVLPEQFFVVVTPSADLDGTFGVARFYCVVTGVRQVVQVLPADTPTEAACPAEPFDPTGTADIPLPPLGSTDIPLPLPPVSADIAVNG